MEFRAERGASFRRSEIRRGPPLAVREFPAFLVVSLRDTEIAQDGESVVIDENILGLEVQVAGPLAVQDVKGLRKGKDVFLNGFILGNLAPSS